MKRLLFSIFFVSTCTAGFSQTTYSTTNTSNQYAGQWTKVASITISTRYASTSTILQFTGGSSSNYVTVSKLFFRVEQQSAFPNAPYIQLELLERNNLRLSQDDVKAVITNLSSSGNTVELYVRVTNSWEVLTFTPILIARSHPTFYSNQPFSTSLPAGTPIACRYVDQYAVDGQFLGKVGIGTTSPSEELEVNGTIRAKEVKVEAAPWPDYVFSEDYKLSSLEETDAYIKEHGHLPNIPSAEEVAENGISLGEMNAKLLEKVEELTLHLIEKDKEIRQLKLQTEEIESLKADMEEIKQLLSHR